MDSEKKKCTEDNLFREAMAGVSPLNPDNRIPPAREKYRVKIRQHQHDDDSSPPEDIPLPAASGDIDKDSDLLFLRPGYQKRIMKRLRRGHYGTDDVFDLHHMQQHTARKALLEFMAQSWRCGFRCVRVIHGKGLRSLDGPRLKIMTREILLQHPKVIAFTSCRPEEGGSGAVNILFQAQKENSR